MAGTRLLGLAVMLPLLTAACSDSIRPPRPATIEANTAINDEAFSGGYLAVDPEVLVRDENGSPIGGVTVTFAVTGGGGSVANSTTTSGPQGRATAGRWTLGPTAGTNTLVGTVAGVGSVVFTAVAVSAPSGRFELTAIDGHPLPYTASSSCAACAGETDIAATFAFGESGTFTESLEFRLSDRDGAFLAETSGTFSGSSKKLLFYVAGRLWADGRIDGDTLRVNLSDFDDRTIVHMYVRASLP